MKTKSKAELYRNFLEYVTAASRKERQLIQQRMWSVFLWCFAFPAVMAFAVMLLIQFRVLPRGFRGYLDWVILVFPVAYSIHFLGSQVFTGLLSTFKKGAVASSLSEAQKEGFWRENICDEMSRAVVANHEEWKWILHNFKMDLDGIQQRNRFVTALAGAVFFLIIHGIDSLHGPSVPIPSLGWVESTSSEISQFIGLIFFLLLFYLSGNQNYQSLRRYLNCAELIMIHIEEVD